MPYKKVEGNFSLEKMIYFITRKLEIPKLGFIIYTDSEKSSNHLEIWDADYDDNAVIGDKNVIILIEPGDWIKFEKWIPDYIESSIKKLDGNFLIKENQNIGISSCIHLANGIKKHILMIDFRCAVSRENEKRVLEFISETLGLEGGFLLESGRSYHFYSSDYLLGEVQWVMFNNLLIKSDLVGEVWPKLQIRNGFSILRITNSKNKPVVPKIIGTLNVG